MKEVREDAMIEAEVKLMLLLASKMEEGGHEEKNTGILQKPWKAKKQTLP